MLNNLWFETEIWHLPSILMSLSRRVSKFYQKYFPFFPFIRKYSDILCLHFISSL